MEVTLRGIPICGAARPTPGAFLMTLIMSSMMFCTFSDFITLGSTSCAGSCRTGSPALTVSGKLVFFLSAPSPKNHPALALTLCCGLAMPIVDNNGVAVKLLERQNRVFGTSTRCKCKCNTSIVCANQSSHVAAPNISMYFTYCFLITQAQLRFHFDWPVACPAHIKSNHFIISQLYKIQNY